MSNSKIFGVTTRQTLPQEKYYDESIARVDLSDFTILEKLGKGSFGNVYAVRMKETGTIFAIKFLNKKLVMNENIVKYAIAERNVLTMIEHPFLVSMHFSF